MSGAVCNGCGQCCDPVVLPFTQREVASLLPGPLMPREDRDHVLYDLEPLSRREGLARAPYLTQGGHTYGSADGGQTLMVVTSVFYRCRHYDAEERRCLIYEARPPMCRGFPWYGDPPDPQKALPPDCSFVEDIPEALRHPEMRERLRRWRRPEQGDEEG